MGDSWLGNYGYTAPIPESFVVLPWSSAIVMIGGLNVTGLLSVDCQRSTNFGAGKATIRALDANRFQSLLFSPGQELEIYLADTNISNKVWGGYIQTITADDNNGQAITISANEYAYRLSNYVYSGSFSGTELSTALNTVLSGQSEFALSIPTTTSKPVSGTFTNETMYSVLQKLCDTWDYYFLIDMNRTFSTQLKTAIIPSPDTITAGSNATRTRSTTQNKEYLCNKVTILGSGGTSAMAQDSTSQAQYGLHEKQIAVGSLSTASACQNYANQYIVTYANPFPTQALRTKFLPYTDPYEWVTANISSLGLSGSYQVVSISHQWSANNGLRTEVELSNPIIDLSRQLGSYERRLNDLENLSF